MSSAKPDLILLHGALASARQLESLSEHLQDQFSVHVVDFEGHGHNPPPSRTFRMDNFASNVIAYMTAGQIESAHVFGYSMGGYVGLCLARHYADRIKSVVTLATKLEWTPEFAAGEVRLLNPDKMLEKIPRYVELLEHYHPNSDWRTVVTHTAEMMSDLGENPRLTVDDAARISVPVCIAVGDKDHMVTREECESWVVNLSKAKLEIVEDTPHPFEKVDVQKFAEWLKGFLVKA